MSHVEAELADFVMGTLGPEDREEVEHHLSHCPHCSSWCRELRAAYVEAGRRSLEVLQALG